MQTSLYRYTVIGVFVACGKQILFRHARYEYWATRISQLVNRKTIGSGQHGHWNHCFMARIATLCGEDQGPQPREKPSSHGCFRTPITPPRGLYEASIAARRIAIKTPRAAALQSNIMAKIGISVPADSTADSAPTSAPSINNRVACIDAAAPLL